MEGPDVGGTVLEAVQELSVLLRDAPTEQVVGHCVAENMAVANGVPPRYNLSSRAKQQAFLLSVFLATPSPFVRRPLSDEGWERVYQLLETAFLTYMDFFWPDPEELEIATPEWHERRTVAMSAFLHYFNTGLLASSQQIRDRIERYIVPFDDLLAQAWGVTASDAVDISAWIEEGMQSVLDESTSLLGQLRRQGPDSSTGDVQRLAERFGSLQDEVASVVRPSRLRDEFGGRGDAYARQFFVSRGRLPRVAYPTEQLPWETHVGVYSGQDRVLIPLANALYSAVLAAAERFLSESPERERFFRHRDQALELEVAELFGEFFPEATRHAGVYETADRHYEHDLIVIQGDTVLVVEAKASAPVEPFRDPDRAFRRLSHAFHADSGIQHGYDQAKRIRAALQESGRVELFDANGEPVAVIQQPDFAQLFEIVVTRDNFGFLATNLSLLLRKQPTDPYPWVINVLDLAALVEAWRFQQWSLTDLKSYLAWRLRCHGKVLGSDELEFVGYHVRHGSLESAVQAPSDFLQLNPSYSDFFDALYRHLHLGAAPPENEVGPPVLMDLRRSLESDEPVFIDVSE